MWNRLQHEKCAGNLIRLLFSLQLEDSEVCVCGNQWDIMCLIKAEAELQYYSTVYVLFHSHSPKTDEENMLAGSLQTDHTWQEAAFFSFNVNI